MRKIQQEINAAGNIFLSLHHKVLLVVVADVVVSSALVGFLFFCDIKIFRRRHGCCKN